MNPCAKSLAVSAALVAASLLPAHAELDVINLKKAIETSIASDYPKLDALYKELHAHPELAFQEVKTAARLAAEMRALGFDVTEKVGRTGLVAIYRNGDGPTIMVRTELDGAADGREDRPRLCEPRQDQLERAGGVRRP